MIESLSTNDILLAQHVKRWHMIRMSNEQSVAEHSYNVAMLTIRLLRKLDERGAYSISPAEQLSVMEWALCHDIHEIEHGDVPSPSAVNRDDVEDLFWDKRNRTDFPSFEARNFVSLIDKVEAYIYFKTHGYDGVRNGDTISGYLYDRVKQALSNFNPAINYLVHDMIHESSKLYVN